MYNLPGKVKMFPKQCCIGFISSNKCTDLVRFENVPTVKTICAYAILGHSNNWYREGR